MMFSGKVVIVTGGAQGIGLAISKAFLAEEARVAIVDIQKKPEHLSDQDVFYIQADIGEDATAGKAVKQIHEKFGQIDIMVNNAGIGEWKDPMELSVEQWQRVIDVNLRGTFLFSRETARQMPDGGAIVNISSTRAIMSEPNSEAYAASKGGILALTHAMAASLAPRRIRVNAISPGWIENADCDGLRKIDHEQHFSGRVGRPEDIARACLFLCDPENEFVTGTNVIVDGGMTRKMVYEE